MKIKLLLITAATLATAGSMAWTTMRATPVVTVAREGWQPFTADFKITARDGTLLSSGRYWRARDGSDRRDVDSVAAADGIQIRRIADRTCYRFKDATGWTAQPMLLPEEGWLPQRRPARPNGTPVSISGIDGWRVTNARGDIAVHLAALDDFRAVRFIAGSGRREEFSNIVRGDPDPALFLPPAGAQIVRLSRPAGIIARPTAQAQPRAPGAEDVDAR